MGFAPSYGWYVAGLILFTASDAVFAIFLRTARARLVPEEQYGVAISAMVLLVLIPFPLAGMLLAMVPFTHIAITLALSGCVACAAMGLAFRTVDRHSIDEDSVNG